MTLTKRGQNLLTMMKTITTASITLGILIWGNSVPNGVISPISFVSSFVYQDPFSLRPRRTKEGCKTGLFSMPGDKDSEQVSRGERQIRQRIIERLFCPTTPVSKDSKSRPMLELSFAGIGTVDFGRNEVKNNKEKSNGSTKCIFLAPQQSLYELDNIYSNEKPSFPAIAIPLGSTNQQQNDQSVLNLLRSAYENKPMSKSRCLALNSILINRDGTLFDALPWSSWTIGNHTLDMAGNPIDAKYHFGKRDAFQRFMGKDWPGRSLSYGNLAQQVIYMMEQGIMSTKEDETLNEDAINILAKRILEIECQELIGELAELEQNLAFTRNSKNLQMQAELEESIRNRQNQLAMKQETLLDLENPSSSTSTSILEAVVNHSTQNNTNAAPHRGAYGFSPLIDSKTDMYEKSILPYTGPYDLLNDIVKEQLQADVIGCVLENTWILDDRVMLGGACVLQRKRGSKKIMIAGEEVEIFEEEDEESDYDGDDDVGITNKAQKKGVKGGEVYIAECDADETIGLALAMGSNIQIEKELWENMNVMVNREQEMDAEFPTVRVIEKEQFTFQQANTESIQEEELQEQEQRFIPKTTASLFSPSSDNNLLNNQSENSETSIKSLSQLDEMNDSQKAKILRSLDAFRRSNGKLPRPRTLKQNPNILTEQLLPYVDESARREYNIRQAIRDNDMETANVLQQQKSRRHMAKDMAESSNDDRLRALWEEESDFYASLRADVTQDEGSYSSYLDKDDWYERDRLKRAKNVKKSSFGTLLDGVDW